MDLPNRFLSFTGAALSRGAALGALSSAVLWPDAGRTQQAGASARLQPWPVGTPSASGIHDIAPAPDVGVWFSAQRSGPSAGSIHAPESQN